MILKGYMMMMTLEEKIKIITAYHNKETVERLYEYDGVEVWQPVGLDAWNFELGQYRIKPNSAPKFKVGDVLVDKTEEGKANPALYKCTEISNDWYYFDGGVGRSKKFAHSNFIDINEVLWFFTGVTPDNANKLLNTTMTTIPDIQEYYKGQITDITPMYSIGFRLPISNKETDK